MNELHNLLETSRGPEARQREGALEVSVFLILSGACYSVRRKNRQNNGYFSNLRECAIEASRASRSDVIEDRGAIEASRSDAPGDRSIAKRCSRGIADDDAPGGVSVGAKRRSPPRASSSSDCRCPPVLYCSPHAPASFISSLGFLIIQLKWIKPIMKNKLIC